MPFKLVEHRVIVAGSRGFNDYALLCSKLDKILSNLPKDKVTIISGTAKGADQMGEDYAREHELGLVRMPADWDTHKRRAGYIRNEEMAKYAQPMGYLVAFWDGKSPGTKHMIDLAHKHGLTVRVVRY